MGYRIERSKEFEKDLDLIYDHLYSSFLAFRTSSEQAALSAHERILQIEEDIELLSQVPRQGTLRPELGSYTRKVTKRNVIFYFDVFEENQTISFIAVYFGGQDHLRHN